MRVRLLGTCKQGTPPSLPETCAYLPNKQQGNFTTMITFSARKNRAALACLLCVLMQHELYLPRNVLRVHAVA